MLHQNRTRRAGTMTGLLLAAMLVAAATLVAMATPALGQAEGGEYLSHTDLQVDEARLEAFVEAFDLDDQAAAHAAAALESRQSQAGDVKAEYRRSWVQAVEPLTRLPPDAPSDERTRVTRQYDAEHAPIWRDAYESTERLRQGLFTEWAGLLTEDQRANEWPAFKRDWRRETWQRPGALYADERLDLIRLIDRADIDPDSIVDDEGRRPIVLLLDEYAREMDRRVLRLRDAIETHRLSELEHAEARFEAARRDAESPSHDDREMLEDIHDQRTAIIRLNRRYIEHIGQWLSDEPLASFMELVREARAPTYYTGRQYRRADAVFDEVRQWDDLSDVQAEAIDALWLEYDRRRHRQIDETIDRFDEMHRRRFLEREDLPQAIRQARQARQALLDMQQDAIDDVTDVLTESQRHRLADQTPD